MCQCATSNVKTKRVLLKMERDATVFVVCIICTSIYSWQASQRKYKNKIFLKIFIYYIRDHIILGKPIDI